MRMGAVNDNARRFVCDPLAYGAAEAAFALSVSESTIWIWIREGKLETFKYGSRTLIRREALLRRLDELEAAGSRPTAA